MKYIGEAQGTEGSVTLEVRVDDVGQQTASFSLGDGRGGNRRSFIIKDVEGNLRRFDTNKEYPLSGIGENTITVNEAGRQFVVRLFPMPPD